VSEYDVYEGDMLNQRFSDAEMERLLTGQTPENPELALLGTVLAAVHVVEPTEPSDERVAEFAANAAALAREHMPETKADSNPVRRRKALATIQERLAVAAVAMFVLVGMSGLAVAADAAAPGDALYGIDRVLEKIGINDGAAGERIAEAGALASRGQVTEAIGHAVSAIEDPANDDTATSDSQAATALREAAVSVESGGNEAASEEVRVSVSAMLSEMAELIGDPDLDGAEFGRRVSEMARSIAGGSEDNEDIDEGPAPGRTDLPEDRGEGRPDGAGPPDDKPGGGLPDDTPGGPPDHAGGSSGGGPPSDTAGEGGPPAVSGRP
jgi:hypothetical protein